MSFRNFIEKLANTKTHSERRVEQNSGGLLSPPTEERLNKFDEFILTARETLRDENFEEFHPIAVRDECSGNAVISFNTETKEFILSVNRKVMGPINLTEIKILKENLTDVIDMKGRYLFIKEYDRFGSKE